MTRTHTVLLNFYNVPFLPPVKHVMPPPFGRRLFVGNIYRKWTSFILFPPLVITCEVLFWCVYFIDFLFVTYLFFLSKHIRNFFSIVFLYLHLLYFTTNIIHKEEFMLIWIIKLLDFLEYCGLFHGESVPTYMVHFNHLKHNKTLHSKIFKLIYNNLFLRMECSL